MDLLQLVRLAGAKVTKRKRSASCQEGSGSNSFSPPTPKSKMDRDPQSEHVPDDDEIAALVVVAGAVSVLHWLCGNDTPIESIPRAIRDAQRGGYLERILGDSDVNCINMLRMNKDCFFQLCDTLRGRELLRDSIHVTVEQQLAMFLHTVGHNIRNRVIGLHYLRSGETVSRYFHETLRAIGELRIDYIKGSNNSLHPSIRNSSRFWPYFKDCVGAIDGTHIHASLPSHMVSAFRGRKDHPTQNVLAAVDFDMKFTYVLAGWEGSAHDALILRDAIQRPNGLKVSEGKYYLVDGGYSTKPGFLSPYRGVRYHLSEFDGRAPRNPKELYNHRQSSLRSIVERTFGHLKNRFKILTSRPFFSFRTQVDIVIACCILHNYIIIHGGDELLMSNEDESQPTNDDWVPQNVSQFGMSQSEQQTENAEWKMMRDQMAQQMWVDKHPNQ